MCFVAVDFGLIKPRKGRFVYREVVPKPSLVPPDTTGPGDKAFPRGFDPPSTHQTSGGWLRGLCG